MKQMLTFFLICPLFTQAQLEVGVNAGVMMYSAVSAQQVSNNSKWFNTSTSDSRVGPGYEFTFSYRIATIVGGVGCSDYTLPSGKQYYARPLQDIYFFAGRQMLKKRTRIAGMFLFGKSTLDGGSFYPGASRGSGLMAAARLSADRELYKGLRLNITGTIGGTTIKMRPIWVEAAETDDVSFLSLTVGLRYWPQKKLRAGCPADLNESRL